MSFGGRPTGRLAKPMELHDKKEETKMTQFYEGQEVEVGWTEIGPREWRRGMIMEPASEPGKYKVMFRNGDGAIVDEDHIRAIELPIRQTCGAYVKL